MPPRNDPFQVELQAPLCGLARPIDGAFVSPWPNSRVGAPGIRFIDQSKHVPSVALSPAAN